MMRRSILRFRRRSDHGVRRRDKRRLQNFVVSLDAAHVQFRLKRLRIYGANKLVRYQSSFMAAWNNACEGASEPGTHRKK